MSKFDVLISYPWQNHYMESAFLGFVSYMAKDHMKRFYIETGEKHKPAYGNIEAMIDESTGANSAWAQRFIDWCVDQFGTPEDL